MNKFIQTAFAVAALSFTAIATTPASAAISVDPFAKTETAANNKGKADFIKVARRGGGGGFHGGGHRGFRGGRSFHRGHGFNRGHRWGGHRGHRWNHRYGWGYSRFGRCRALQAQGYRIRCFR